MRLTWPLVMFFQADGHQGGQCRSSPLGRRTSSESFIPILFPKFERFLMVSSSLASSRRSASVLAAAFLALSSWNFTLGGIVVVDGGRRSTGDRRGRGRRTGRGSGRR